MPQYDISIPGKGTYTVNSPVPLTDYQAYKAAVQESEKLQPQSGGIAGIKSGVSSLKEDLYNLAAKANITSLDRAKQVAGEEQAYREATFKDVGWDQPLTKLLGLAGQSLPYMAAPIAAAAAGATASPLAALGAAGLASAGQFTGSNLTRQAAEKGGLENADAITAAAWAVPQAALDTFSLKAVPFVRRLFGQVGKELTEEQAKAIVQQTFKQKVADYALATGKTMGREGWTETAQQMMERLQAGLSVTDASAKEEAIESFIGGAALAGILGPAGRYAERGREQQDAQVVLEKQKAKQKAEAKQVAADALQQPNALNTLLDEYRAAKAKAAEYTAKYREQSKSKDPADKLLAKQLNKEKDTFYRTTLMPLAQRVAAAGGEAKLLGKVADTETLRQAETERAAGTIPLQYTGQLPGLSPEEAGAPIDDSAPQETAAPEVPALSQEEELAQLLYSLNQQQEGQAQLPAMRSDYRSQAARAAQTANVRDIDAGRVTAGSEERGEKYSAADKEEADYLAVLQAEKNAEVASDARTEDLAESLANTLETPEKPAAQKPALGHVYAGTPPDLDARLAPLKQQTLLRARLAYANATKNTAAANDAKKQLQELKLPEEKITATGVQPVEGLKQSVPAGVEEANKIARIAQLQLSSFDRLARVLELVRRANPAQAARLQPRMQSAVEQIKGDIIGASFDEVESRRAAGTIPAMSPDERQTLLGHLSTVLEDLTTRSAKPLAPTTVEYRGAQQRSGKTVRGAEEVVVDQQAGTRLFSRLEPAVEAVRGQLRDIVQQAVGAPPAQMLQHNYPRKKNVAVRVEGEKAKTKKAETESAKAKLEDIIARLNKRIEEKKKTYKAFEDAGPIVKEIAALEAERDKLQARIAELTTPPEKTAPPKKEEKYVQKTPLAVEPGEGPITRVYKNTSDIKVVALVGRIKTAIAQHEGKLLSAQRALAEAKKEKDAEGETKARKAVEKETKVVENLYKRYNDAFNTAPLIKVNEAAEAKLRAEQQAESQSLEVMTNRLFEQARIPKPSLPMAFRGPIVEKGAQPSTPLSAPLSMRTGTAESKAGETTSRTRQYPQKEAPEAAKRRKLLAADAAVNKTVVRLEKRVKKLEAALVDTTAQRTEPVKKRLQTLRDKAETALTKARKPVAIEDMAGLRTKIAEAERQLEYIKAHPSQTEEGKARQAARVEVLSEELFNFREDEKRVRRAVKDYAKAEGAGVDVVKEEIKNVRSEMRRTKKEGGAIAVLEEQLRKLNDNPPPKTASAKIKAGYKTRVQNVTLKLSEAKAGAVGESELDVTDIAPFDIPDKTDIEFSFGTVYDPSTKADVTQELKRYFTSLARLNIFDTAEDLITAHPEFGNKGVEDSAGFVDHTSGQAYLIAKNINKDQALSVALHEIGAHIGMRRLLGDTQYVALKKTVQNWAKKTDDSIEAEVARRAQERAGRAGEGQNADELLAYTVEEAVAAGVEPRSPSVLGRMLAMLAKLFQRALRPFGWKETPLTAQQLVDMALGAAKTELKTPPTPTTRKEAPDIEFSKARAQTSEEKAASDFANENVAEKRSLHDRIMANLGLGFRQQFVDMRAPQEEALMRSVKEGGLEEHDAMQALYHMRDADHHTQMTTRAVLQGAPKLVESVNERGQKEWMVEATDGPNIKKMAEILSDKKLAAVLGSSEAVHKEFTGYELAKRALVVGPEKLNFNEPKSEAELKAIIERYENDPVLGPAFKRAAENYNEYNKNLLEFAVQTGYVARETADAWLKSGEYVPYYRKNDGVWELMIGHNETPMRIGNMKDNPQMEKLLGGSDPVTPILISSVENTAMIVRESMRNLSVKNMVFTLNGVKVGDEKLVEIHKITKKTKVPDKTKAVEFSIDGVPHYATVNTDLIGIPADLFIRSFAGIHTLLPTALRWMAPASRMLRRFVMASPLYIGRLLFRDSFANVMTTGSNMLPLIGAIKQMYKATPLDRRGITGGQVYTGMPEDISRLLERLQGGHSMMTKALLKLEQFQAAADSLSRRGVYDSARKQGRSDMEASLLAMESMNFSRRGSSASLHYLATVVPFFNAQIQGMDVLYRAARGKMPMNEKLQIQQKLFVRGALLMAGTLAYAMAMQDEDEYKNAKPEEKALNWFLRLPFLDDYAGEKVIVRVPVPFEVGYIFKSIPELAANALLSDKAGEEKTREAMLALRAILMQSTPGIIPQLFKPAGEAMFNHSLYTGRGVESQKETPLDPKARYREETTELAKLIGQTDILSPVKIEHLIRGYFGGMGLALFALPELMLNTAGIAKPEGPDKADKRLSRMRVFGGAFQPSDGGAIIDEMYEIAKDADAAQRTYKAYIDKGEIEKAQEYLEKESERIMFSKFGGTFTQQMAEINKAAQAIRADPDMSPPEKRKALDELQEVRIAVATAARDAVRKK